MLLRIFILSIGLLLGPAVASAANILVYGDSLSSGYGLPAGRDWPSLLAQRLREEHLDYTVVNASVTGETTRGGFLRINDVLRAKRPAIVILELGANDGLRGQSIDTMVRNLKAMIDACRNVHARVVLVGMHLPPNYGAAYTEKFQRAYVDLARKDNIPFVPFLLEGFAERQDYFQPDNLHPAAQAEPLILDTVWQVLRPLLAPASVESVKSPRRAAHR